MLPGRTDGSRERARRLLQLRAGQAAPGDPAYNAEVPVG